MGFTNPYPAGRLTVDSTNSLGTGLLLWAPLTEGTGTTADCIVHAGHTGTQSGGVSWASDSIGSVASFDGVDDYFDFGTFSSYFPGPSITGSLSAWVKWFSGRAIMIGNQVTGNERLYIGVDNGLWSFGLGNYSWNNGITAGTRASAVSSEWAHVVLSISSGVAKLYVNGTETITKTDTSVSLGGQFTVGAYFNANGFALGATNRIQNVRIYDRALSATEVTTLYHRPWEGSNYGNLWPYSPPASASMTLSTDTAATSIMADIEGWWVMTDGSGTTLKDISGNGRDATLSGTNTWETETLGTANRFDNTSSRTSHAATANTQPDLTSGYTFSTWVKHEEAGLYTQGPSYMGSNIVLGDSSGNSDLEIYFNIRAGVNQWPALVHNRSNGGTFYQSGVEYPNYPTDTPSNDNGDWVHYALTYNGSVAYFYRNATQYAYRYPSAAPLSTSGYKLFINGLPVDLLQNSLTCSMQNTRLWSRALSATEIATLYERPWEGIEYGDTFHYDPPAPASMLPLTSDAINTDQELWLPLTDGTGTTAVDISGGSNDGTLNSDVTWGTFSVGTVAVFDDSLTSQITVPHDSSYNAATTGKISVSAWVKVDATRGDHSVIIGKDDNSSNREWLITIPTNLSVFRLHLWDSSASLSYFDTSSFSLGEWHFVCMTWDGSTLQGYLDGVADGSASINSARTTTVGLRIGESSNNKLDGLLQNVRLWSRALTADEVWSIYSNPWLGSNYKLASGSGSTPLYNYIFRTERFRRLG